MNHTLYEASVNKDVQMTTMTINYVNYLCEKGELMLRSFKEEKANLLLQGRCQIFKVKLECLLQLLRRLACFIFKIIRWPEQSKCSFQSVLVQCVLANASSKLCKVIQI